MRTEELVLKASPRDPLQLSAALQDLVPHDWQITDERGKRVPLSSAGYVLYFGRRYQLRIAVLTGGEDMPNVTLASYPEFLKLSTEPTTAEKHGRHYHCLPFWVQRRSSWLMPFKGPYEVSWGALDVRCVYGQGADEQRQQFSCPVVARTAWSVGIVLLLVVGAVAGWLLGQGQKLLSDVVTQRNLSWNDVQESMLVLQTTPRFWLWPAIMAVVNPVCAFVMNVGQLRERSKVLEHEHRKRAAP